MSAKLLGQARQDLSTALGVVTNKHVPLAVQTKVIPQINGAFVAGMHRGVLFAAAATLLGVIIVLRYLPAHGVEADNLPESTSPDEVVVAAAVSPNGHAPDGIGPTAPALVPDP